MCFYNPSLLGQVCACFNLGKCLRWQEQQKIVATLPRFYKMLFTGALKIDMVERVAVVRERSEFVT